MDLSNGSKIKVGTKIKTPYFSEGKEIIDEVAEILLDFHSENYVDITLVTKLGYIIYDDQLESIEILAEGEGGEATK